jgi:hypothetical protein
MPALWRLEVAIVSPSPAPRQRSMRELRRAALDDLALLDITSAADTDQHGRKPMLLADSFGLTVYDADL